MHNSFIGKDGALILIAYDFDDDAIIAFLRGGVYVSAWVIDTAGGSKRVRF